ncbi:MAG: ribokinase [Chthoniobacterales bacterium]
MSAPILVIGSFVQDLTFFVDRFPAAGETLVGQFTTGPGGKGSNQAVAAARAGAKTAFVGAVGHDAFGDAAEKFLAAEGIEQHLLRVPDAATGTAGITVNAQGQNQIVVALGASEKFTACQIDPALLAAAQIVVLQYEIHPQTVDDLLQLARAAGKTTILNPAPMHPAVDFSILANVDIFIPNETEFVTVVQRHPTLADASFTEEKLAALSPMELHSLCRRLGVPTVIVTLGKRGCFISQTSGHELVPACSGIQVVDTTGAGDAFVGGFAAGLIAFGGDIVRAARHGNVVAGLSVTKPGTAPSMPTQAEIEAFLS